MSSLTIVCISNRTPTQWYYCYGAFLKSCEKFGHSPVIIDDSVAKYGGLGSRPRLIKAAIEKGLVPTEHMLFADCWDLFFQRSPDELIPMIERTHFLDAKILISGEKNCFPRADYAPLHPPSDTSYKYVNSGFILGNTTDILESLNVMKCEEIPDDHVRPDGTKCEPCCQEFWTRLLVLNEFPITVDHHCEASWPLCGVSEQEAGEVGGLFYNKETGSTPIALHANGGAKSEPLFQSMLKKAGYR